MTGTTLFVCDGHFRSGFGHASRCLEVAQKLITMVPRGLFVFQGVYSNGAKQLLMQGLPHIRFADPNERVEATVAFIDRMSNFEDIEACDHSLVSEITSRCEATYYLSSGVTVPKFADRVRCIGYQPGGPRSDPPDLMWGLEYSPVSSSILQYASQRRNHHSAFVGLGGAPDDRGLILAAEALASLSNITEVTVLLSPVNSVSGSYPFRPSQKVKYIRNVREVGPYLAKSGIVLASFGNLAYQALALGSPLCLLSTKRFQVELAEQFVRLGIAVNAGSVDGCLPVSLGEKMTLTLRHADILAEKARLLIDGYGIDRISQLLSNEFRVG